MKKQIIPIAVIAVILLAGLALWFGLRGNSSSGPSGVSADGVTIFAPQDTEIIVINNTDSEEVSEITDAEKFTVSSSGSYNLDLEPGDYTLLVTRGQDHFPWHKNIVVSEETATEFYPILLPQQPEYVTVDSSDPSYETVSQAFAAPASLPTAESPKKNTAETAELYVDGNFIYINWLADIADMPEFLCPGENVDECRVQPIFEFDAGTVENIEFFGENDEMLLLDRGSEIKVLEVDRRGGIESRNQQPVYTSNTPTAFRLIDNEIYVSDSGVISRIVLN